MKHVKKFLVIALSALMVLTVFTACSASPEKKLIGSWRDSTGMRGYEFKEDGKCVVTFADVNVPVFNVDLISDIEGVYTVAKREDGLYYVTITYTLYAKSVTKDYMFTVEESALTLQDTTDNSVTVLMAYTAPADSTVPPTADSTVA